MNTYTNYQKYKIPPDFQLAKLHADSCKLYKLPKQNASSQFSKKCGCCNQLIGDQGVSVCVNISKLSRIGEEVPLFFHFNRIMVLFLLLVMFLKSAEYLFFCQDCQLILCKIPKFLFDQDVSIPMGFQHIGQQNNSSNTMILMIQIIIYAIILFAIKVHLKAKKYRYKALNSSIEKRSLQLINLPKDSSEKQIRKLLKKFDLQEVVFAYRVREYHKCMIKISKLSKALRHLTSQIQNNNEQEICFLRKETQQTSFTLQKILNKMKSKEQRLSIAFVVFKTNSQRNKALHYFSFNFISKMFFKLCTCCSNFSIRGHHITIQEAPAPDDIQWENLENPYLRTKGVRLLSFFVCGTILVFGLYTQVILFNDKDFSNSTQQFIRPVIIFISNFIILNFLEYSTKTTQARQSKTVIKLSLIRKITFFMFLNVSISPFLIIVYNRLKQSDLQPDQLLQTINLSVLIVCIGNCFKPLLTVFSIERFASWIKIKLQMRKGSKSFLNQLQANDLFEPLDFQIQVYYSILHTSLMTCFFYLGCYQGMLFIQIPSILILYFSSKWMLLRVCKQPRGLSLKLNNLAQSLVRFYVPLYWLGRSSIQILTKTQSMNFSEIIKKIIYEDIYKIITTSIVLFMLLCQPLVAKIAKLTMKKTSQTNSLNQSLSISQNNRTYRQANMFYQIRQQNLIIEPKILSNPYIKKQNYQKIQNTHQYLI